MRKKNDWILYFIIIVTIVAVCVTIARELNCYHLAGKDYILHNNECYKRIDENRLERINIKPCDD